MSILSRDSIVSMLNAELSFVNHGFNGRVRFTIQSGEPSSLTEEDVFSFFSSLGNVDHITYVPGDSSGNITFSNVIIARDLLNKVMVINNCTIHIIQCFSNISAYPIPYQIMIESANFPTCWEKHVIVKNFFNTFGEVAGVYFMDRGQKLVVSFKEDKADEMVGTLIKVPWNNLLLFVREVSSLTLTKI